MPNTPAKTTTTSPKRKKQRGEDHSSVAVWLPHSLLERLAYIADRQSRTRHSLIVFVLKEWCETGQGKTLYDSYKKGAGA